MTGHVSARCPRRMYGRARVSGLINAGRSDGNNIQRPSAGVGGVSSRALMEESFFLSLIDGRCRARSADRGRNKSAM